MLYFFRLLFLFINIDQETVLNWFGMEAPTTEAVLANNANLSNMDVAPESGISIETFRLVIKGLWQHLQGGLNLNDIENLLFFIVFIRFIVLTLRYNLKTSFYITSIGLCAGYLWYRHLIDLTVFYRSMLLKVPYLHKLGLDGVQIGSLTRQLTRTNLKIGDDVHWYDPGRLVYCAFIRSIINVDTETGLQYYIDPLSMIISNLKESQQAIVLPIYYKIYKTIIPQFFDVISNFWNQLSGIAAYAMITRIGKKYCPYLVRWHWTFLIIIGFLEQIVIYFSHRILFFQSHVLIPQIRLGDNYGNENLLLQFNFLNILLAFIVCGHFCVNFLGLFHAIWGQYFYFPFFVENTELHTGLRPKNSIYSGGNTSWQDEKEQNVERFFPKLWYGWFGSGTNSTNNIFYPLQNFLVRILKRIRTQFRR
jgi:Uncharacterised protein family